MINLTNAERILKNLYLSMVMEVVADDNDTTMENGERNFAEEEKPQSTTEEERI